MNKLLITDLKNNLTLDPLSKELLDSYSKFDLTNVVTLYYQKGISGLEFPFFNLVKSRKKDKIALLIIDRDSIISETKIKTAFITLESLEEIFEGIRNDDVLYPLEKLKEKDKLFVFVDYHQIKIPKFSTTIKQEKLLWDEIRDIMQLKRKIEFSNFLNIALDDFENEEEIVEAIKNWAKER